MTQRNLNLVFSTHLEPRSYSSNEPFYDANALPTHNYCPYELDIHNRVVACNCTLERRQECANDI